MSTVPLGGVLGALNHLIAAALEECAAYAGRSVFSLDSVSIDEKSFRIAGSLRAQDGVDRFVVRLDVSPPVGTKQTLTLCVEQWPAGVPPPIQWLKPLLDQAELAMTLDFERWMLQPAESS